MRVIRGLSIERRCLTPVSDAYRYLQDDTAALHQYLGAESKHAKTWMQPLAAVQRQLQLEMLQALPDQPVRHHRAILRLGTAEVNYAILLRL